MRLFSLLILSIEGNVTWCAATGRWNLMVSDFGGEGYFDEGWGKLQHGPFHLGSFCLAFVVGSVLHLRCS